MKNKDLLLHCLFFQNFEISKHRNVMFLKFPELGEAAADTIDGGFSFVSERAPSNEAISFVMSDSQGSLNIYIYIYIYIYI